MVMILLSPAKKFATDSVTSLAGHALSAPQFMDKTRTLVNHMRDYSAFDWRRSMKLSQSLIDLNIQRYKRWDFADLPNGAVAALYGFQGDAYRALSAPTLSQQAINYLSSHLLIISGLYGLLRPLDGILPYRLEMGSKVTANGTDSLYSYWSYDFRRYFAVLRTDMFVNLASQEYARALLPYLQAPVVSIVFKNFHLSNNCYQTIGVLAKRARGMMVRFIAQNAIDSITQLRDFSAAGYRYVPEESNQSVMVFCAYE